MRRKILGALSALVLAGGAALGQPAPPPPLPALPTAAGSNEPAPPLPPSTYQPPPATPTSYQPPSTTTTTVYQPAPSVVQPEQLGPPSVIGLSPVAPLRLVPVEPPPQRIWFTGELLLWWTKNTPLPAPIATVTDASGNTQTVIGQSNTSMGLFTGGRFALGAWFDSDNRIGIETNVLWLDNQCAGQSVGSNFNGAPSVGLSFLNQTPTLGSGEFIQPLSTPGTFAGNIQVASTLSFWGTEVNGAFCFLRSGGFEIVGLAGFRYLDLLENLYINASSTDLTSGNYINLNDQFSTRNQFYGGNLGAKFSWQTNRLIFEATAKLAIGATHESVDVQGSSYSSAANMIFPGGFYAQPSNMGHYTATQFGIIPAAELKVAYQFRPWGRVFLGYDFLYWNQVVRPGNQIDRNVNLSQSPILNPGVTGGPASPMPMFNRSDFWAQGLTLGFEFRF